MRTNEDWRQRCLDDGELALALRGWTGGLRIEIDGDPSGTLGLRVAGGVVAAGEPTGGVPSADEPGVITLAADRSVWSEVLAPVPAPRFNDVTPALRRGLRRRGDELLWWQYLPAVQRAIELLAEDAPAPTGTPAAEREAGPTPRFDGPVGRYVHLELDGLDHRLYFEEAGRGIPLLLQHTAGSHGVQWRHLFEVPAITEHFRLIAYDLPYHGKSVPPVGTEWWSRRYQLFGSFLRSVPVQLAAALQLERPVFMGCSVGGLLALDLALHHPDVFRAVISLEGALRIGGDLDSLLGFWHPAVSNETKARMMQGLTAPKRADGLPQGDHPDLRLGLATGVPR
ncbi:MAG: alpha/beta fold hydrolase [Acidimicrobiales bacterium]